MENLSIEQIEKNKVILDFIKTEQEKYNKKTNRGKPRKQLTVGDICFKLTFQRLALQVTSFREGRGWTVKQLAMRSGVKEKLIRKIEIGKHFGIDLRSLVKIAKAFDCTLDVRFISIMEKLSAFIEKTE